LQAEASACVSGLANVQFCAWAFHYFDFFFLSLSSKLSVRFCLFTLTANVPGLGAGAFYSWPCVSGKSPGSLAHVGGSCFLILTFKLLWHLCLISDGAVVKIKKMTVIFLLIKNHGRS